MSPKNPNTSSCKMPLVSTIDPAWTVFSPLTDENLPPASVIMQAAAAQSQGLSSRFTQASKWPPASST